MNRFKCPACGGNQYTACDTAEGCMYCEHQKLEKMDKLELEDIEKQDFIFVKVEGSEWRGSDLSQAI